MGSNDTMIERSAAAVIDRGVVDLAGAAVAGNLSASERIARATLAFEAHRAAQVLPALADPYRDRAHTKIGDAVAAAKGDDDARARLDLSRSLQVNRAWQGAAGGGVEYLFPQTPNGGPGAGHAPLSGVLDLADTVNDISRSIDIPAAWSPHPPVGVLDPDGSAGPIAPVASSTAEIVEWPTHYAAAWINLSRQLTNWGTNAAAEFDALVEYAARLALEAGLVADMVAAAGTVAAAASTIATIEAAEAASGVAWGAPPDTLVCHPADWPSVRHAHSDVGEWPMLLRTAVSAAVDAGTVIVYPSAAVVLVKTATEWLRKPEPDIHGDQVAAGIFGGVGFRNPDAVIVAPLPAVGP